MMTTPPSNTTPPFGTARQQGIAALRAGDIPTARRLLSEAIVYDSTDVEAWFWLSSAVSSKGEQRYCLLRVQALNQDHAGAVQGLAGLPAVEPIDPLSHTPLPQSPVAPGSMPSVAAARPWWFVWAIAGGVSLIVLSIVIISVALSVGSSVPKPVTQTGNGTMLATPAPANGGLSPTQTADLLSISTPPAEQTPGAPFITASPSTNVAPTAPSLVVPGDDSAPALAARGLVRERRDADFEGAMADFTAAIALDPSYADAYYLRSALHYTQGDFEQGQRDLDRAIEIDSTSAHSFYHRGRIASSLNHSDALTNYNDAIRLDPGYAQAYYSRAVYKTNQGNITGAIDDYTAAVAADPQMAFAYANRANLYDDLGKLEAALEDYDTAIRLDPLYYHAYYNRAYAYRWYLNDPASALPDYEMAVKLRPSSAPAHCEMGSTRFALGDAEGGLRDTSRAIELDPQYSCAYYSRGRINNSLHLYADAIADFTRYMKLEPDEYISDALIGRGVAYAGSGDIKAAVADYTRSIELNPQEPIAYKNRGNCYITLGDIEAAKEDLSRAAELFQQQGELDSYNRVMDKLDEIAGGSQ